MAYTQRLIHLTTATAFILLLLVNGRVNAESNAGGVQVAVWNNLGFNASPPLPSAEPTGELTDTDIWHNFDQQPLFNLYEDFIVRFQSNITTDVDALVRFYAPADDGVQLFINNQQVINDWVDKGGGGSISQAVAFTAGLSQPITLWFYENGGGAWVQLYWQINDGDWQPVPASAFTLLPATPTTTEAPTTTDAPTTTQETSTTTTIGTQTTHHLQVTVPSSSVPSSTVAEPVLTVPATTTTSPAQTTLPSTVPVATVPVPESTYAPTTTQQMPTTTLPLPEPTLSVPSTTTPTLQLMTDGDVNAEEATVLATDAEVLQTVTADQAQEIFDALELDTLSATQLDALVEAVQEAPTEVREAFEETINIFDGAVDSYVPIGSTVPISTRRLVIAASAMLAAVPMASAKRN
jgi:hypothetical protein